MPTHDVELADTMPLTDKDRYEQTGILYRY